MSRKKIGRVLIFSFLLVFVVSLILICLYFINNKPKEIEDTISSVKPVKEKENGWELYSIAELDGYIEDDSSREKLEGNKYILLLGIDSREDDLVGRSDSILLLNLDKNNDKVNLINIPRDSYVNIPYYGYDKINHSYAYGSEALTTETVENLFGIDIDNVVSINFQSFEKVIDILGGVEVDVAFDFTEKSSTGEVLEFKKGKQLLSGEEALAYARMRKQDSEGDVGRGKRQQEVIEKVLQKGKEINNIFTLKTLYEEISKNVRTDIDLTDALDYFNYIETLSTIEKLQLKGVPTMIEKVSYMKLDTSSLEEIKEILRDVDNE